MTPNEDWTAEAAGLMHKYRIRNTELAEKCGYHPTYLSTVMNGNKKFESKESADKTRDHILSALNELIKERAEEVGQDESSTGTED